MPATARAACERERMRADEEGSSGAGETRTGRDGGLFGREWVARRGGGSVGCERAQLIEVGPGAWVAGEAFDDLTGHLAGDPHQ